MLRTIRFYIKTELRSDKLTSRKIDYIVEGFDYKNEARLLDSAFVFLTHYIIKLRKRFFLNANLYPPTGIEGGNSMLP